VWIACHDPAEAFRLQKILETEGYEAHLSRQPPANTNPSLVVYGPGVEEVVDVASEVRRLVAETPAPPSWCSAASAELQLARAAL
jgi:hypothetical protein